MEDVSRTTSAKKGSSTSLGTVDEDSTYVLGQKQQHALEDLHMQGLADTFQFLPPNAGHVAKVLAWFPELITKIIE